VATSWGCAARGGDELGNRRLFGSSHDLEIIKQKKQRGGRCGRKLEAQERARDSRAVIWVRGIGLGY
jgi:hypothetical protein